MAKSTEMTPLAQFVSELDEANRETAIRMFNASGEGMAVAIARDLMNATDADALFSESTVEDWAPGTVIEVTDVKLNESASQFVNDDSIFPVYAVVTGKTDTGEPVIVTCGGTNVVAQLIAAVRLNALPRKLMMTSRMSRQNRPVLKLVHAPGNF